MTSHSAQRKRTVFILLGIAAALWAALAVTGLFSAPRDNTHADMGRRVLPGFAQDRFEVSQIRFTMADERYTLVRTDDGWVMQEEAGFPVREDRLRELAAGLKSLTLGETRTSDPQKHDQILLGHPENGGTGVLVEIFDAEGKLSEAVLTGRKAGRLYVRAPDQAQTYRASGELPPFYNRRAWLDFDIVDIAPDAIRSVRLTDRLGESAYFAREPGGDARSFKAAPPYQDLEIASRLGLSTTALAITRLDPNGAKRADDLTTAPVARHISETFDGLEIDLRAYQEPDGQWVTFRAIEAGEGARRAQVINDKAEGWAFRLSAFDWQDFTPLLRTLVIKPEAEAPDE